MASLRKLGKGQRQSKGEAKAETQVLRRYRFQDQSELTEDAINYGQAIAATSAIP